MVNNITVQFVQVQNVQNVQWTYYFIVEAIGIKKKSFAFGFGL